LLSTLEQKVDTRTTEYVAVALNLIQPDEISKIYIDAYVYLLFHQTILQYIRGYMLTILAQQSGGVTF